MFLYVCVCYALHVCVLHVHVIPQCGPVVVYCFTVAVRVLEVVGIVVVDLGIVGHCL